MESTTHFGLHSQTLKTVAALGDSAARGAITLSDVPFQSRFGCTRLKGSWPSLVFPYMHVSRLTLMISILLFLYDILTPLCAPPFLTPVYCSYH